MSDHELLPELPPRLRALVDEERATIDHDPARMSAVLLGVEGVIAAKTAMAASAASTAAGGAASATAKGAVTASVAKAAGIASVIFVFGAGVGAATYHVAASPRTVVVAPVAMTATPVVSITPPLPSAVPSTASEPSAVASHAPTIATSAAKASPSDLSQEQAIIDAARAGLASGRPEVALEAVARHERMFPRGQLSEERDGMRILALVRAGREDEARKRADQFRRAHPTSALLSRIDDALR